MLTILYIHLPFLKLMEKWSWSGVFLCIDQLFLPFSRVLLERLIVNRPHPWGLLITFIELIKNPAFKFWNHEFVHCAPEIEKWVKSNSFHCFSLKTGEIIIWWLQLGWVIKKGVVAKISKTQGFITPEFFSLACTCFHSSGYSSPSHSAAWDKSRLSK